jgi:TRAP-type C4-dicarboxylate transport system permease large subunit
MRNVLVGVTIVIVVHVADFHVGCRHRMDKVAALSILAPIRKVVTAQLETVLHVGTMVVVELDVLLGALRDEDVLG